jgi:hypothetical protein
MSAFTFLSIEEFKSLTSGTKIDFLQSTTTGKLFASCGGKNYKSQQDINGTLPVRFMYSQVEGFDSGCFINVKPLEVKFSL